MFVFDTFWRRAMRRWDRFVDSYMEEYRARGVCAQSVAFTEARLDRWGRWLKRRRPRVAITIRLRHGKQPDVGY